MKKYVVFGLMFVAGLTNAQQHALFKDADLKAGETLIAENQCN